MKTTGDILTLKVIDPSLSGGSTTVSYTVLSTDTLSSIATSLKNVINADAALSALGVTATSYGQVVTIRSASETATTYEQSTNSGATEKIGLSINQNALQRVAISGSTTTGDTITFTVYDQGLTNGFETLNYTVSSGDTLTSIATNIANSINANSALQNIGVSATSVGQILSAQSDSLTRTTLQASTSLTASEIMIINPPATNTQTDVIGGTKTTGDVLTVTVYNENIPSGSKAINYTVVASDTIATIASGLAAAISADLDLIAINITATSNDTVLFISSDSSNTTTYKGTLNHEATENIAITRDANTQNYSCNNINEITTITAGGGHRYYANSNKALQAASVNGNDARFSNSREFIGDTILTGGGNQITISASDDVPATVSNTYHQINESAILKNVAFDENGNMTNDSLKTYEWDAADRLLKITYIGANNFTSMVYDGFGRCVKIIETSSASVIETKQHIWCGEKRCEERDNNNLLTQRFFFRGQKNNSNNYYYNFDQLGSITEMTNSSGATQANYIFGPYGEVTKISGSQNSDFQYAGYYAHLRSSLNLTRTRSYNSDAARWLSRDPMGEEVSMNLYAYAANPISFVDPLGLALIIITKPAANTIIKCCTFGKAQHIFLYSTETGESAGMGPRNGMPKGWSWENNEYPYTVVQPNSGSGLNGSSPTYGTGSRSEAQVISDVRKTVGSMLWLPGINDCHSRLKRSLEQLGITWPGTLYGRFK